MREKYPGVFDKNSKFICAAFNRMVPRKFSPAESTSANEPQPTAVGSVDNCTSTLALVAKNSESDTSSD